MQHSSSGPQPTVSLKQRLLTMHAAHIVSSTRPESFRARSSPPLLQKSLHRDAMGCSLLFCLGSKSRSG